MCVNTMPRNDISNSVGEATVASHQSANGYKTKMFMISRKKTKQVWFVWKDC